MRLAVVTLVLLLAAASADDLDWWKTALIYQIYPRSFKDSNADGIGDLKGITEKLSYLRDLGVDAIWLSPIYLSPMYDFGYDITDYRKIAPEYGTDDDFKNMLKEAKALGVRVVLDLVPNHTSNESTWFTLSAQRDPLYADYYIWADAKNVSGNEELPSNWVSNFRKSAWEWNKVRGQYYLHQFVIGQPDLNYRNATVREEMKNVIRYWLDLGVSGFRVDAVNRLYEADPKDFGGIYPDEPVSGIAGTVPDDYEYLTHTYTQDLDETYEVVYDWRDLLDEYITKDGEYKIMMTEAYTDLDLMIRYYGTKTRNGSIPFNFNFLTELSSTSTAWDMKTAIDSWMTYMPSGKTANWVNGNHDQSRMASRHGVNRVDAMNMLALILPGIAITYQGEEIGMTDGYVSWADTKDPQACNTDDPVNYYKKSRDPNRTPYHWDSSSNAGFSTTTNKTWLPVADNYQTVNLAAQMASTKSHYQFYKDVVATRKSTIVKEGDLYTTALSESVLAVTRLLPNSQGVLGVINLSAEPQKLDLSSLRLLPNDLKVVASGVNCANEKGTAVVKTSISVSGNCALLLESVIENGAERVSAVLLLYIVSYVLLF